MHYLTIRYGPDDLEFSWDLKQGPGTYEIFFAEITLLNLQTLVYPGPLWGIFVIPPGHQQELDSVLEKHLTTALLQRWR